MLIKLCIYILVLTIVYFLVPNKVKWCAVLATSIVFYLSVGIQFSFAIIFTAVVTYTAGRLLMKENERRKKRLILTISFLLCFGMWMVLKVFHDFNGFVMPLGISYYTLMGTGYLVDIYHKKYPAEKNFLKYFSYLSFFLQIIQGPVSRFDSLSKTLFTPHSFSIERLYEGILRIAFGIIKKCIIADRLALSANYIFANYQNMNGIYMFLGMIFWAVELYADFSGYMDIVNGAAYILGIENAENFRQPFFARSIEEFWRRWHISLGAWFRDYMFYPISISKWAQKAGKKARSVVGTKLGRLLPSFIALFFVWSATGLWHGVSLHFLFWGLMQMVVIMSGILLAPVYDKVHSFFRVPADAWCWKCFQMLRTFLLFAFMEIMSQAGSVTEAISMYGKIFTSWNIAVLRNISTIFPDMLQIDRYLILGGMILILIVDILREKKIKLSTFLMKIPMIPRYVIYIGVCYVIVLCAARSGGGGFAYATY